MQRAGSMVDHLSVARAAAEDLQDPPPTDGVVVAAAVKNKGDSSSSAAAADVSKTNRTFSIHDIPDPLLPPFTTTTADPADAAAAAAVSSGTVTSLKLGAAEEEVSDERGGANSSSSGGKGSAKERIMCPVCRTVVVRRVYRRHFETMHCVQDPVTCQFCQKVFKHRYREAASKKKDDKNFEPLSTKQNLTIALFI